MSYKVKKVKVSEKRSKFLRLDNSVHSVIPINEDYYYVYTKKSRIFKLFGIALYASVLKKKHKKTLSKDDIKDKKYMYLKNLTIQY